jgi:hypothetical protein
MEKQARCLLNKSYLIPFRDGLGCDRDSKGPNRKEPYYASENIEAVSRQREN